MTEWKREPKTWAAIAITLVLWASAFAGIKAGMRLTADGLPGPDGFGPGQVALLRFGVASLVLAGYAVLTRMSLPAGKDLPRIFISGFLGISIYHVALNFGELRVSAGAASLLIAAGPVFTAIMSVVFLREHITLAGWVGIGTAFAGVALIAVGEGGGLHFEAASLLILLAALTTSAYFIVSKRGLAMYSALQWTAYTIWAGTLPMLIFAPGLIRQWPGAAPSAILSVVYLGVFPAAIAYVLWSYALSRMPASSLTVFLNVSSVIAVLIAWIWLGEVPALLTIIGGAIAIAGVVIVQTKGQPKAVVGEIAANPVEASEA
ncbi:MAG: EamA family transporter [Coriobacteriia bacterium]|nr:EamA family transporter [Coriobacteriia bacterium]